MSVSFDTLKAGDILYDCHRHKLGNTTMSVMGVWKVYVKEVSLFKREALTSWNGNPAKWVTERFFRDSSIRRFPPEWSCQDLGGYTCYMCGAKKSEGHKPTCTHPKAKKPKVTK